MPKSYCNLLYHIVFSTKNRHPWFQTKNRCRLHQYLGGITKKTGGIPLSINGTADHVHVFAKINPDRAVADLVHALKANASGWIHRTFPGTSMFQWQSGYGAFTVGRSEVDGLRECIENQEEHHRKMTFEEEFRDLLREHGME